MDMHTLADAHAEGYAAYNENRSSAPTLSSVIRDMVGSMEVGEGAAEIFQSFTDGYTKAADDECARIMAE